MTSSGPEDGSRPRAGWEAVDLGPIGRVDCPPGWTAEGPAADGMGAAAVAPDGEARLVVHAVIHQAEADGDGFAARIRAAAERVLAHVRERPGAETNDILTISGAPQPILEIGAAFFDDSEQPQARIRQWHALRPLDDDATRIAVIAFSLMTPALAPVSASEPLAAGFRDGLRAAAVAISHGGN